MQQLYSYKTRDGVFFIAERSGRFDVIFEGKSLGSYMTPEQAAEELAKGHTFRPPGIDTSKLGIPDDLSDWDRLL